MILTPAQAERWFAQKASRLPKVIEKAEATSLREAKRIALRLSSGHYSQAQLTRMGHPYARRKPKPPQDPAIINKQTGNFFSAWKTSGPFVSGEAYGVLFNDSYEAQFLTVIGSKLMIGRPIEVRLADKVRPLREKRMEATISRFFG